MHGFEFTQFDIFSLEIIAAQSCNLAMVISFKVKKKNRNFWLLLTRWAKGLCFTKCFDGKNVFYTAKLLANSHCLCGQKQM